MRIKEERRTRDSGSLGGLTAQEVAHLLDQIRRRMVGSSPSIKLPWGESRENKPKQGRYTYAHQYNGGVTIQYQQTYAVILKVQVDQRQKHCGLSTKIVVDQGNDNQVVLIRKSMVGQTHETFEAKSSRLRKFEKVTSGCGDIPELLLLNIPSGWIMHPARTFGISYISRCSSIRKASLHISMLWTEETPVNLDLGGSRLSNVADLV